MSAMKEDEQRFAPGVLLREKLVAFQREIVTLKQAAKDQEEASQRREQELFLDLLEVLDALDTLEQNMQSRPEGLDSDKSSKRLLKNIQAIQRKLLRLLKLRHIVPLDFHEGKAEIERCRIVATQAAPNRANEEILHILKKGYMDVDKNAVLRKAEVVTVCNTE
jgi:molecular chaperone GrpE (heat shock protein)